MVCILLGHIAGEMKLIKIMMSRSAQGTELVIGQTTDRDIGAGVNSDICIAFRKVAAHIQHGTFFILVIDSVCAAVNNRAAAIWTAHAACIKSLSFFLSFIHFVSSD